MKRLFGNCVKALAVAFFLNVCCVASTFAQISGDTYAEAKKSGVGNVVLSYVETPGFAAKGTNGKVDGFCVALMTEFAKWLKENEGIELKPTFYHQDAMDFKKFMEGVKSAQNGVFGLGNITITEERKQLYNFSPPFITNISILVTHKNVATLPGLDKISSSFGNMTAIAVKGTTNEDRINKIKATHFPAMQIKYLPTSVEALQEVANNPAVFSNLDFTYYLQALKDNMPVKRHPAGDENTEAFGIIMPKSNDWAPVLAKFMNSGFVGSTEYRKLISDHLGPNALRLLDAVGQKTQ